MDIFICCSKAFYDRVPKIKSELEHLGHIITLPNSFENPQAEAEIWSHEGSEEHARWKSKMFREQIRKVEASDAVLVLNFKKDDCSNYIGGSTFLEMYEAWKLGKHIFMYKPIPDGILRDEIHGFSPIILNSNLSAISRLTSDESEFSEELDVEHLFSVCRLRQGSESPCLFLGLGPAGFRCTRRPIDNPESGYCDGRYGIVKHTFKQ